MKAIVIAGGRGMLGTDLAHACAESGISAIPLDMPELDITNPASIADRIPECDILVNCAAFTAVDDAEKQREAAFAVNCDGAGHLAEFCARCGILMVHISTDYVFDGAAGRSYSEDDATCPLSAYGESKLAGEEKVRASGCRRVIVRTQSLFGRNGRNFVETILRRLEEKKELKVVTDQTSCPTYTRHLAAAILHVLECGRLGTVNIVASGSCTWHEFASAIARGAGFNAAIGRTTSAEYRAPAKRPAFSVLDTSRYAAWTGKAMPTWQEGLDEYLLERTAQRKAGEKKRVKE